MTPEGDPPLSVPSQPTGRKKKSYTTSESIHPETWARQVSRHVYHQQTAPNSSYFGIWWSPGLGLNPTQNPSFCTTLAPGVLGLQPRGTTASPHGFCKCHCGVSAANSSGSSLHSKSLHSRRFFPLEFALNISLKVDQGCSYDCSYDEVEL